MEEQQESGPVEGGFESTAEEFEQAYKSVDADNHDVGTDPNADSQNVELQSAEEAKEDNAEEQESFLKALDPTNLPEDLVDFYKSMQGDYTRSKQKLAEERKQFEAELEAARENQEILNALLGGEAEELYDGEEYTEDGEIDEVSMLRQRLDALEAERQAEQQQRQSEAENQHFESLIDAGNARIDELAKLKRHELDDADKELLWSSIISLGPDESGGLQVERAYKLLEDSWTRQQQRWLKSKESQSINVGSVGEKALDEASFDNLADFAAAQYAAIEAGQK